MRGGSTQPTAKVEKVRYNTKWNCANPPPKDSSFFFNTFGVESFKTAAQRLCVRSRDEWPLVIDCAAAFPRLVGLLYKSQCPES